MLYRVGDIISGRRILDLAGSGGMGTVYKAEHLMTRRIEAMKVLPLGVASGADEVARFEREIQVHARLQHPNIAALYDASRENDAIVLVMEYVEGEPLANVLQQQRLPLETSASYARQALDALAYAHRLGVIHCDVSPTNLLITRDGIVKLMDFGLARAATDLGVANPGVAIGSPWHMSPEQVRGTGGLDARTDVYAMGTVLYEMLAGRKLFDVEGSYAILRAHLDLVPALPGFYRRGIPAALDAVVGKALAKDPGDRFRDAAQFLEAMDAALADPGRRTQARRILLRRVWIASGMAAVACAGVLNMQSPWRAAAALLELPPLLAPAPSIPPAPLPLRPIQRPEPETVAATAPSRPRPAEPKRASTPASFLEQIRRIEPRASYQTAAADAALPEPGLPEAPSVEAIRLETPPPAMPVEAAPPALEQPKRPAGNRFVRALGKLNPFRKGDKDQPAEQKR